MKPRPNKNLLRAVGLLLTALMLSPLAHQAFAAPAADGGGYPTSTPTPTQVILPTATPTFEVVIVTLQPPYPVPSDTPASLDPGNPSNIQEAAQPTPIQTQAATSGRNPLFTAAYIALFIFLVVGVWMLFSRRGLNQGP